MPRRLCFTACLLLTLVLAQLQPASAVPQELGVQAAERGARWLADHIDPVSGPVGSLAHEAIALAATRVGNDRGAAAVERLAVDFDQWVTGSGGDNPGRLGLVLLAAAAYGRDGRRFGGTAPRNDLVMRLLATKTPVGLFGTANPHADGAYRQSLSLLGLASADVAVDEVDDALWWLSSQQCPEGGWSGFNAALVTCAVGARPDVDSTAMAVMALRAWQRAPQRDALAWLRSVQNADGGFGFLPGSATNANSTALAIQAIVAAGEDPSAGRWVERGPGPVDALLGLQLPCGAADAGAFAYMRNGGASLRANAYATAQAVPAAAGVPLPLDPASEPRDAPAEALCP